MKNRYFAPALAAVLAACGGPSQGSSPQTGLPPATRASVASGRSTGESVAYNIVQLPTLGGTQDFANWINDGGWVAGAADLTGGHVEHAFLWRHNKIHDLGTLGGNNSLAWPVNDQGVIAGDSVTSIDDPLRENFCHFNIDGKSVRTKYTCSGYMLLHDVMTALPTLGGNNSQVFGMNNRGVIVGNAETTKKDPSCTAPQQLDFEAVVWRPQRGKIEELPPFKGDPIGAATAINDSGEVVGASGICAPVSPAIGAHALLWRHGKATNLGGFGGKTSNVAWDINNRGHIVGFSDLSGDTATHAFFWKGGRMTDLGTLPGDVYSFAFGINERDQVVGESCDASFNCRAFIWQEGAMSDLNALAPSSTLYLMLAESINSRGEITGIGFDQSTGGVPAFVAIPTSGRPITQLTSRPMLPAGIRARLKRTWASGT
jgi:probable HAF family extracellular repeat protein